MHRLRNLRIRLHKRKRRSQQLEPHPQQNPRSPHGTRIQFCINLPWLPRRQMRKSMPRTCNQPIEVNSLLIIDEKKCKGCDWCVQACPHGGIAINAETGKAIACNLCEGEPKCIQACPEEALDIVESDEAADKHFNDALEKLPAQTEQSNSNSQKERLETTNRLSRTTQRTHRRENRRYQQTSGSQKRKTTIKS